MIWWQILLIIVFSLLILSFMVLGGMFLALRLFMTIFINDENYARWVEASNKWRKLLRIKGMKIEEEVKHLENGGY